MHETPIFSLHLSIQRINILDFELYAFQLYQFFMLESDSTMQAKVDCSMFFYDSADVLIVLPMIIRYIMLYCGLNFFLLVVPLLLEGLLG